MEKSIGPFCFISIHFELAWNSQRYVRRENFMNSAWPIGFDETVATKAVIDHAND